MVATNKDNNNICRQTEQIKDLTDSQDFKTLTDSQDFKTFVKKKCDNLDIDTKYFFEFVRTQQIEKDTSPKCLEEIEQICPKGNISNKEYFNLVVNHFYEKSRSKISEGTIGRKSPTFSDKYLGKPVFNFETGELDNPKSNTKVKDAIKCIGKFGNTLNGLNNENFEAFLNQRIKKLFTDPNLGINSKLLEFISIVNFLKNDSDDDDDEYWLKVVNHIFISRDFNFKRKNLKNSKSNNYCWQDFDKEVVKQENDKTFKIPEDLKNDFNWICKKGGYFDEGSNPDSFEYMDLITIINEIHHDLGVKKVKGFIPIRSDKESTHIKPFRLDEKPKTDRKKDEMKANYDLYPIGRLTSHRSRFKYQPDRIRALKCLSRIEGLFKEQEFEFAKSFAKEIYDFGLFEIFCKENSLVNLSKKYPVCIMLIISIFHDNKDDFSELSMFQKLLFIIVVNFEFEALEYLSFFICDDILKKCLSNDQCISQKCNIINSQQVIARSYSTIWNNGLNKCLSTNMIVSHNTSISKICQTTLDVQSANLFASSWNKLLRFYSTYVNNDPTLYPLHKVIVASTEEDIDLNESEVNKFKKVCALDKNPCSIWLMNYETRDINQYQEY